MIYFLWKLNRIPRIGGVKPQEDKTGKTQLVKNTWNEYFIGSTENYEYLKQIKEFNPIIISEDVAKGLSLVDKTQIRIGFRNEYRNLTEEELLWQKAASNWINKEKARTRIELEVNDDRDLIADISKRLDIIERGLVRLLAHVLGGTQMTEEYQIGYLQYAETIISLVDSLQYIPRADLDNEQELIQKLISDQNKISKIVKEEYLDKK